MMRATFVWSPVLLAACHAAPPAPSSDGGTNTALHATTDAFAASPAITELDETDFRGAFAGAAVVATLRAHASFVSGKLFYESIGSAIDVTGTLGADGSLVLHELSSGAPVSTIHLRRVDANTYEGDFAKQDGGATRTASLAAVRRNAGEPVVFVTRQVRKSDVDRCGWTEPSVRVAGPCALDAKVPVALGLADRAFERSLDETLAKAADVRPPPNPAGLGVTVTYELALNERGFVSILLHVQYTGDAYAYTHSVGSVDGLSAAVDTSYVAKSPSDIVDMARAERELSELVRAANEQCVVGPYKGTTAEAVDALVVRKNDVEVCVEACSQHVSSVECDRVPYSKLRGSLRADSPFAPLWTVTKQDAGP